MLLISKQAKTISLILALLMFLTISCSESKKQTLIKEGNEVAVKVEAYKAKKGKLPNSLNEIGVEEKLEGPIFYEKKSDTEYRLWFGSELGESVIYNSSTRKWE